MTREAWPICPAPALDTLWLQVAGTVCNLECAHCFISCSPANHAHAMMTLASVRPYLEQAEALGVRDYYLTGGEPFINPEILAIIEAVLRQGPVSILTNALPIRATVARRLRALADASPYSLDLRVSLDGYDAATNDPIRGAGTFDRVIAAVRHLAEAGLTPILTVTEACEDAGTAAGRSRLLDLLAGIGLPHPRLKIMPLLRIGAETARTRGYTAGESPGGYEIPPGGGEGLACASGRMVTSRGVYVCPILIEEPAARMGDDLAGALRPFPLRHAACWTCLAQGLSCLT